MKKILIILAMMSQSIWAYADQPLNKVIVEAFIQASANLDTLESKYPDIFQRADQFSNLEDEQFIQYMESSAAYPDIKRALFSSGFQSLEDFVSISKRLMASMYAVQIEQMPAGLNINAMMESGILAMKQTGASAEMIAEMQIDLDRQKAEMEEMNQAAKNVSAQDKKFARDNMAWLMSILPDDDQ